MKSLFISLLISSGLVAQWDYHAHFWGSATATAGIHITIGKQEKPVCIGIVFSIGLLKEIYDSKFRYGFSKSDLWADASGCVVGFIASDIYKRKRKR